MTFVMTDSNEVFFIILPCAVINLSGRRYFHSHILPGHVMVFGILHIPEVCIWSPEQFSWIGGHVEWFAVVVLKPWIVPPLPHEYVHRIFL